MSFVAKKLMDGGYLTKEQADEAEKRAEAFVEEVYKSPELFRQAVEKLAVAPEEIVEAGRPFWERYKDTIGGSLAGVLAAATISGGLGLGANFGIHGFKALKSKLDKARGYKAMLEENPNLKELDPDLTQKAFSTLHRFNPAYASDPFVAGQFVRTVTEQERMDLGALNNIVKSHSEMSRSGGRGAVDFFSGITGGAMVDPLQAEINRMKLRLGPMQLEKAEHEKNRAALEEEAADYQAQQAHGQMKQTKR